MDFSRRISLLPSITKWSRHLDFWSSSVPDLVILGIAGGGQLNLAESTDKRNWFKLRAPNFVCKYTTWSPLSADEKLTLKVRGLGHVTHFEILGPLYIFGVVKNTNFVVGAHIEYNKD